MQWLAQLCEAARFATVLSHHLGRRRRVHRQMRRPVPKIDLPIVMITTIHGHLSRGHGAGNLRQAGRRVNTISIEELRVEAWFGHRAVRPEKNIDTPPEVQKVNAVRPSSGHDPPGCPRSIRRHARALHRPARARQDGPEVTDTQIGGRRRLESVSGGVRPILGGQRQLDVAVDPIKLKALGISALEVAGLSTQNLTSPEAE